MLPFGQRIVALNVYLSCMKTWAVLELLPRRLISNLSLVEKRLLLHVIFQWLDQGRELPLSPGVSVEFRHRKLYRLIGLRCVLVANLRSSRRRIRICERVHGDHTANCRLLDTLVVCLREIVDAKHVDFALHCIVHAAFRSQSHGFLTLHLLVLHYGL